MEEEEAKKIIRRGKKQTKCRMETVSPPSLDVSDRCVGKIGDSFF